MNARSSAKHTPIRGQQRQADAPERLIDPEGERLVVANILTVPGFFGRVSARLSDDCFAIEQNRRVYQLARKVYEAGDDPLLSECFRAALDAEIVVSLPSPALAYDNVVEITNPERWVRSLNRKAAERRLWRAAEGLRLGVESGIDAAGELATARAELRAIEGSFDAPAKSGGTISDTVASIGIDTLLAAPRGTILSPWNRLNYLTNDGPKPGELWLVGPGRASARARLAYNGRSQPHAPAIAFCLSRWRCRGRT